MPLARGGVRCEDTLLQLQEYSVELPTKSGRPPDLVGLAPDLYSYDSLNLRPVAPR